MIDPFRLHEFRDRASLLRDLLDRCFDEPELTEAVAEVDVALCKLQTAIEALEPIV